MFVNDKTIPVTWQWAKTLKRKRIDNMIGMARMKNLLDFARRFSLIRVEIPLEALSLSMVKKSPGDREIQPLSLETTPLVNISFQPSLNVNFQLNLLKSSFHFHDNRPVPVLKSTLNRVYLINPKANPNISITKVFQGYNPLISMQTSKKSTIDTIYTWSRRWEAVNVKTINTVNNKVNIFSTKNMANQVENAVVPALKYIFNRIFASRRIHRIIENAYPGFSLPGPSHYHTLTSSYFHTLTSSNTSYEYAREGMILVSQISPDKKEKPAAGMNAKGVTGILKTVEKSKKHRQSPGRKPVKPGIHIYLYNPVKIKRIAGDLRGTTAIDVGKLTGENRRAILQRILIMTDQQYMYQGSHHNRDNEEFPVRVVPDTLNSMELVTKKIKKIEKHFDVEEVEKTIYQKVSNQLEQTVTQGMNKRLAFNSRDTQQLTENIYSRLVNRIALEKERLGY